jgi:hypothetical protein
MGWGKYLIYRIYYCFLDDTKSEHFTMPPLLTKLYSLNDQMICPFGLYNNGPSIIKASNITVATIPEDTFTQYCFNLWGQRR